MGFFTSVVEFDSENYHTFCDDFNVEELKALSEDQIEKYKSQLKNDWEVIDGEKIRRKFGFPSSMEAIGFVDKIAACSEELNHHPDIHIYYNEVVVELSTHKISSLSKLDFDLALKIDKQFLSSLK